MELFSVFISYGYHIIGYFYEKALLEDRDDYELMRNLNQQYESNFLRFQKLWFGQDSDQLAEPKREYKDKPGL